MRLLVCGSRTWVHRAVLYHVLDEFTSEVEVLIHGAAKGADEMAAMWAIERTLPRLSFPADWKTHGKAAGPIRNQRMLDEGKPDLVVAFADKPLPESRGTYDMVQRATTAGLRVILVEHDGGPTYDVSVHEGALPWPT